ncbi:uncharacterized protein LOC143882937 [Tasmannia lanceolata]|uniref:uncharacterized protein LOC143882937 n=1 Tax=Tasmannia lanceolata TaxID=3420 RepID=UPI004064155C
MPAPSTGQKRAGGQRAPAHLFALTKQDAHAAGGVVVTTLPVGSSFARVLFDSGATNSFVSSSYVDMHDILTMPMEAELNLSIHVGGSMMSERICKLCPIRVGERDLLAELIVLPMHDFDVILGIDWLFSHYAAVNFHEKVVVF